MYVHMYVCVPVGDFGNERRTTRWRKQQQQQPAFFPKHCYKQTRIHTRMHVVCIPLDSYTVRLNQYLWTPLFALAVGRLKRREQFSKRMLRFCKMILGPNTGKSLMHKVELSVRFQNVISISYDYLLYK